MKNQHVGVDCGESVNRRYFGSANDGGTIGGGQKGWTSGNLPSISL